MTAPGYETYRDSGIDWLGQVPSHWAVKPLKRAFSVVTERTPRRSWALGLENIEGWSGRLLDTETEFEGEGVAFEASDILYGKLRPYLAKVHVAERPGEAVGDFHVLRAHQADVVSRYIAYQLLTREMVSQLNGSTFGARMPRVGWDFMGSVAFAFPPPAEQAAIAAFLDRETGKIDALVEAQTRLIELLKEKRQAVISHAVTKGLDRAAPMRASGFDWLGQVPAHWEVTALKRLCSRITDGAHISPETENGVYCFVSTRDVSQIGIDFEGCLRTSEASYEYLVRTGCKPEIGDVLFSKDGTIGRTTVVREQRDFVVASSLIIIRPDAELLDADFLDYLCQSGAVQHQVESFVKGAGLPRLSITNLTRVIGIFPSRPEQTEIASHLAKYSAQFSALVAEAEATITLLQERRAALISAAVTGKIDVRGLAPQQAEAA